MSLALILLLLGLVSGLARGGRIANLGNAEFRFPALVFLGLSLQVAAEAAAPGGGTPAGGGRWATAALLVSYALLAAFVVANRRFPGALPIGAGLLLNLVVITANGGMPVSADALVVAGIDARTYLQQAVKHHAMDASTRLPVLADVIPVPVLRTVVSAGDVVLAAGLFRLVDALVRYRPRRRRHRGGQNGDGEGGEPQPAPGERG